ncbi:hypothetical protein KAW80_01355 [Candidatus Babeliales bacterium]|nr:hypothetical protein [Candidatus Babeliales bacterium]
MNTKKKFFLTLMLLSGSLLANPVTLPKKEHKRITLLMEQVTKTMEFCRSAEISREEEAVEACKRSQLDLAKTLKANPELQTQFCRTAPALCVLKVMPVQNQRLGSVAKRAAVGYLVTTAINTTLKWALEQSSSNGARPA